MVVEATVPRFPESDTFHPDIPMLQNGWRPTGGPINVPADEGLLNWPLQWLVNRTRFLKSSLDALTASTPRTLTVGPGGQYATINDALSALSRSFPAYVPGGFVATIHLLTGFVMAEQVRAQGVNLGWINITSADAVVTINRAALTTMVIDRYPAFAATEGGVLPQISVLFEMNTAGDGTGRDGIMLRGGQATIWSGFGLRRAGGHGIYARSGSSVSALGADFSQAGQCGIRAVNSSNINAQSLVATGCGEDGVSAESGSTVSCPSATLTGAAGRGAVAFNGARIAASSTNARRGASDGTSDFVALNGGMISATAGIGGTSITPNTVAAAGIIFK